MKKKNTTTTPVIRTYDFSTCCEDFLLLLHCCSIPGCSGEDAVAIALDEELMKRGVLFTGKHEMSFAPIDDSLLAIFITNAQESIVNLTRMLANAREVSSSRTLAADRTTQPSDPAVAQGETEINKDVEIDDVRTNALTKIVTSLTEQELQSFLDIIVGEMPDHLMPRFWAEIDLTSRSHLDAA
jgi:hypothetical protein